MNLPIHTILNHQYRIERVLGIGGFGITYYTRHNITGNEYAVKELFITGKCNRGSDSCSVQITPQDAPVFNKFKSRFIDEANLLKQLNHPHVVHVLYIFEENNTVYLVMNYVKGETLQHYIDQKGPIPYPLAVNYMAQLSEAVGHCHSHNILHRDIKPENIMITTNDTVVLIDFGSARSYIHDEEQSHTTILTQGYAPLEQYTTISKKGNYSDIYSMGAVLYFILTGVKPMAATDRVMNTMPEPIQLVNSIPFAANATILKAMQMKPEYRYQYVYEFMTALLGGTTELVKKSIPKTPTKAPMKKKKRKKTWMVWVIIGGVILTLLTYIAIIGLMTTFYYY